MKAIFACYLFSDLVVLPNSYNRAAPPGDL